MKICLIKIKIIATHENNKNNKFLELSKNGVNLLKQLKSTKKTQIAVRSQIQICHGAQNIS
jgi:hypothetical protein